jgi:hypothetical protein
MTFAPYRGFGLLGSGLSTIAADDEEPIARLKRQIGFSDEPVQDADGYWTIGYGERLNDTSGGPKPEATISEPMADEALRYRFAQDPSQYQPMSESPFSIEETEMSDGDVSTPFVQKPQDGDSPPGPQPSPDGSSALDAYLDRMSIADLRNARDALNDISYKTQIFSLVVGPLLMTLNPATLTVIVVGVGLGTIAVGATWLADEINRRLEKK